METIDKFSCTHLNFYKFFNKNVIRPKNDLENKMAKSQYAMIKNFGSSHSPAVCKFGRSLFHHDAAGTTSNNDIANLRFYLN